MLSHGYASRANGLHGENGLSKASPGIIENIKRGDQGWDLVRNVALGRARPNSLSVTDSEGATWMFRFGETGHGLTGYSQVLRSKRIDVPSGMTG